MFGSVLQHKDAYQGILDGVKGGPKEKRLAAQFIPKFFSSFPELADAAINAQLDLCEDEDVSVRILSQRHYHIHLGNSIVQNGEERQKKLDLKQSILKSSCISNAWSQ